MTEFCHIQSTIPRNLVEVSWDLMARGYKARGHDF